MSNDLISRSAVLDIIKKHECDTNRIVEGILNLPTAYDVEKVVERLKKNSMPFVGDKNDRDVDLNEAIKIVEAEMKG